MTESSTIVAISTPSGIGGISIIRLSGPSAIKVADEFFCAKSKIKLEKATHAKMNFGTFDLDGINEKGYAVVFLAPNSFTGENVVEIQVHGGYLIAEKIVEKCRTLGAKIAGKGDFSKRAFLNGKASLDSLEGMIDMIHAESEAELRAASSLYTGKLKTEIDFAENQLLDALSGIEVGIDYPDEVDEEISKQDIEKNISNAKTTLQNLLKQKKQGKMLKNGVLTLILGKPNVGKSSVLNSILGENRAIVTATAGTTRDIVKESFVFDGTKFQILDSAGIHETTDEIEKIGIDKAKENIQKSDIVLFVVDSSCEIEKEDLQIKNLVEGKNTILVFNKTDKVTNKSSKQFFDDWKGEKIEISASTNKGTQNLLEKMKKISGLSENSGSILLNERHIEAIEEAASKLDKIDLQKSMDVVAFELKSCLNVLGKISGKTASEEVVSKIFSKFCVGK